MDILIEGSGYVGAWLETQPMGGHMWGKRDLRLARNNQMIFLLNQLPDGQLSYCVKTSGRAFGGLQGNCFPTPAWELYFLLNRDKEYLRCMYHGSFTQEMADPFIRYHLLNPEEFWTPMPLVAIAANDPKFKSITHNNWSGQPQALTFQRAIRALENYGHYAELTLIGEKLLAAVGEGPLFTQQFDPRTGQPNVPRGARTSTYGPSALSALEYIAHLHGVELVLDRNEVWFSGLARGKHEHEYTQKWNGQTFSLCLKEGRFDGLIDGRSAFTCSANVRAVTDLSGRLIRIVGISPEPQKTTLAWGASHQTLAVEPNRTYAPDASGSFVPEHRVPFDYPYAQ